MDLLFLCIYFQFQDLLKKHTGFRSYKNDRYKNYYKLAVKQLIFIIIERIFYILNLKENFINQS